MNAKKAQARFPAGNVPPTFSKRERGPFPHAAEIGRFDRRSKAQAAIEFLTTYGWAMLVIAIVLVALVWLGVFNVQGQVPDRCSIAGMDCSNAYISETDGRLTLRLTNRFTEEIRICSVYCSAGPVGTNGLPTVGGAKLTSATYGMGGRDCMPGVISASGSAGSIGDKPPIPVGGMGGGAAGGTANGGTAVAPTGGTGTIVVPDTGGVTGPAVDGGTAPSMPVGQSGTNGIVAESQAAANAPARTLMLQGTPSSTAVDLQDDSARLMIDGTKTVTSNLPCLDSTGNYVTAGGSLKKGVKYNGKIYVEYVSYYAVAGAPVRLIVGDLTVTT